MMNRALLLVCLVPLLARAEAPARLAGRVTDAAGRPVVGALELLAGLPPGAAGVVLEDPAARRARVREVEGLERWIRDIEVEVDRGRPAEGDRHAGPLRLGRGRAGWRGRVAGAGGHEDEKAEGPAPPAGWCLASSTIIYVPGAARCSAPAHQA